MKRGNRLQREISHILAITTVSSLFVFCSFAVNLPTKPNKHRTQTEQKAKPQEPTTVFVDNENSDAKKNSSTNESPHWYASPEWILAIIGILTLFGIWYQAYETKEAAKAAKDNIDLLIKKERARLKLQPKPLSLTPIDDDGAYVINFVVNILGTTAASIIETSCVAYETPENLINEPEFGSGVMFPLHDFPNIIPPNSAPLEPYAFLFLREDPILSEIKSGRLFVGVRGFIKYQDVFDQNHMIRFRYVWKWASGFGKLANLGDWQKCGTEDENKET